MEARIASKRCGGATGLMSRAVGNDDREFVRRRTLDGAAESAEQFAHDRDVGDVGDVGESVFARRQQTGRHFLQDRVLGAEGLHFAREGTNRFDDE